jgi:hypothetical protein
MPIFAAISSIFPQFAPVVLNIAPILPEIAAIASQLLSVLPNPLPILLELCGTGPGALILHELTAIPPEVSFIALDIAPVRLNVP